MFLGRYHSRYRWSACLQQSVALRDQERGVAWIWFRAPFLPNRPGPLKWPVRPCGKCLNEWMNLFISAMHYFYTIYRTHIFIYTHIHYIVLFNRVARKSTRSQRLIKLDHLISKCVLRTLYVTKFLTLFALTVAELRYRNEIQQLRYRCKSLFIFAFWLMMHD